jgi:hypothetical protein
MRVMAEIKDFSKRRQPVVFLLDGQQYEGHKSIPADVLTTLMGQMQGMDPASTPVDQQLDGYKEFLRTCLLPESWSRFEIRLKERDDEDNSIEVDQLDDIATWLLERYGMRPTQPSGNSPDGPSNQEPGMP